jgi:hypothetical protein
MSNQEITLGSHHLSVQGDYRSNEDHALKILVCSANLGNAEPTLASVAAWIPPEGSCEKVNPLKDDGEPLVGCFDLIAIGLQEATWKKKKSFAKDAKEANASSKSVRSSFSSRTRSSFSKSLSSPINFKKSFSARTSFTKTQLPVLPVYLDDLDDIDEDTDDDDEEEDLVTDDSSAKSNPNSTDSITLKRMFQETLGDGYSLLAEQQRGQMRLYIWVRNHLVEHFTNVVIKSENTGIAHVMANKGGIVATFYYKKTRISFLTAHLAAHEGESYYTARCDSIREILRGAKTLKNYDAATASHHMFVLGDLNFRTKFEDGELEDNVKRANELVQAEEWEKLYEYDELQQGLKKNDLLCRFETLPCLFSPTFKVKRQEGFVYNEKRTPSYTDRILFTSFDGLEKFFTPRAYEACPGFITSDHKPIRGAFTIVPNETLDSSKSRLEETETLSLIFRDMQCFNLPVMDVDGSSDPYVMIMWDSVDLKSDAASQHSRRQSVAGAGNTIKWPRTKFIPKELNPKWWDEIGLELNGTVNSDAMLFVTVMDYDAASQDDLMGTLALNVKELASLPDGSTKKQVVIERPLLKYGLKQGTIKFTLHVEHFKADRDIKVEKKKGLAEAVKKGISNVSAKTASFRLR